jgi:hypothetical protein
VPYIVAFIQQANQIFDPPGVIDSDGLLEALNGVDTVLEGIAQFELLGAIEDDEIRRLALEFIQLLPPSLDAAVLAVLRSALSRGLKTQFTWKPNYAFGLDLWESSKFDEEAGVWVGLVNVLILSPDPIEEAEQAAYDEPGTMGAT